jgi:diguanylate cyclase (GGDEF)-like protein
VLLALETIGLGVATRLGWVPSYDTPLSLRVMLGVAYIATTASIAYVYEREREATEARAHTLADALYDATIRDPLTNLLNRRFFDERLENELAFTRRHRSPTSLLSLDVDHFKRINDSYGHAAGDAVLVGVAHLLRASVRQEDTVARVGGEEFVILLRQTDPVGAQIVAERLLATIAEHSFVVGAERLAVTASIGCATTTGGDDGQTLLSSADARMYIAKRAGRNRVVGDPVAEVLSA